jgi:uncharacterized membrane protein YecN with MAPEG domain
MRVTMFAAGILGLLILVLGVRVVAWRVKHRISLGTGSDGEMEKRIRAHGNCVEWTPIGLILLFLAEQAYGDTWFVIAGAVVLVLGRLLHPMGLRSLDPNFFRSSGIILTFLAVLGLSGLILASAIPRCETCVAAG